MQDLKRRFEEHVSADEASMLRIEGNIYAINAKLEKFENNHFAHIEPDIRILKDLSVRMEKLLEAICADLKQNTKDTQQIKLDVAIRIGEINAKLASVDTREGSNSGWTREIIMILVGGLIGAAIAYFSK